MNRTLRTITHLYREMDAADRRTLELRTGVELIEPWERFARAPAPPRRP